MKKVQTRSRDHLGIMCFGDYVSFGTVKILLPGGR